MVGHVLPTIPTLFRVCCILIKLRTIQVGESLVAFSPKSHYNLWSRYPYFTRPLYRCHLKILPQKIFDLIATSFSIYFELLNTWLESGFLPSLLFCLSVLPLFSEERWYLSLPNKPHQPSRMVIKEPSNSSINTTTITTTYYYLLLTGYWLLTDSDNGECAPHL